MITKKQFDILVCLAESEKALSQRDLGRETNMSLGSVNKLLGELCEAGFAANNKITDAGLSVLEKFRVKRAVVLAAGFGERLIPITLNTPKPLVRINGKRIIDSLIDALIAAEIQEIYIIRGYLKEQLDQLLYKYPMIKFLDNPLFSETNNISSAFTARHLMQNAYVCEADLLVYNPKIIKKYQYSSNYLGVKTDRTDDWCFYTENGIIKETVLGGMNCYHMYGISYWTEKDGKKLEIHLEKAFNQPGGKQKFWDLTPLGFFKDEYEVEVRSCEFSDIIEIDTFNELKMLDKSYAI